MLISIVSATEAEILPTIRFLSGRGFALQNNKFQLLITGVGTLPTTYLLTKHITHHQPDLLIQAGIAGSFSQQLELLSTAIVEEEILGDLGVEESGLYKDVFDLKLSDPSHFPFIEKKLINPNCQTWENFGFQKVRAISINEISTMPDRIEKIKSLYNPDLESMEGAAFHYVCLQEKKDFLQIRTVSNKVGERDKKKWKLKESIETLNEALIKIVEEISI